MLVDHAVVMLCGARRQHGFERQAAWFSCCSGSMVFMLLRQHEAAWKARRAHVGHPERAIAMSSTETIFAAASGFGRSAVCVIRVSGPQTRAVLDAMAGGAPPPRRLVLRWLVEPGTGEVLDQALVTWMPGPNSFTGEDQAELHVHGGLATRLGVLRAL